MNSIFELWVPPSLILNYSPSGNQRVRPSDLVAQAENEAIFFIPPVRVFLRVPNMAGSMLPFRTIATDPELVHENKIHPINLVR